MIYLLNKVGFFIKISVATNPPKDCPIIVFAVLALYFFSINGCNSFFIKAMKLSECPAVGKLFLSFSMVVG